SHPFVFPPPFAGGLAPRGGGESGRLAVGRPAVKLGAVALLAGQFLGQDTPVGAVGLDGDGTPRRGIDVAPAGEVGAKLSVPDQLVGGFVVGILGQEEPLLSFGGDSVTQDFSFWRLPVGCGHYVLDPLIVVRTAVLIVDVRRVAVPDHVAFDLLAVGFRTSVKTPARPAAAHAVDQVAADHVLPADEADV